MKELTKGTTEKGKKVDGSQFVKIAENGDVSLDFGNMNEKQKSELLNENIGLALVNDLVNAKDENGIDINFLYTANDDQQFRSLDGKGYEYNNITNSGQNKNISTPRSTSITPKWIYGSFKNLTGDEEMKPLDGFQGMVSVPQSTGLIGRNPPFVIRRASIVYHELRENYFRTVHKMPYSVLGPSSVYPSKSYYQGYFGAHNESIRMEGQFYGNTSSGGISKFINLR